MTSKGPLVAALAALFMVSPAHAEVADKMLMIDHRVDPWLLPAALCLISLALELKWARAGLLTIPFTLLLAWGTHDGFSDPHVGPAITRELGESYVTHSWMAIGFALIFPIALTAGLSRKRPRTEP